MPNKQQDASQEYIVYFISFRKCRVRADTPKIARDKFNKYAFYLEDEIEQLAWAIYNKNKTLVAESKEDLAKAVLAVGIIKEALK